LTDLALGGAPDLFGVPFSEAHRAALASPLTHLRSALDNQHHAAAVGAAKDLVEAACKVVLSHAGSPVPAGASLPTLFKQAAAVAGTPASGDDLGRSLASTVQRLAELRNAVGPDTVAPTSPR
jgi:hypothetical protein